MYWLSLVRSMAAGVVGVALLGIHGPASAVGEGSIDHAETRDGTLRVLYSMPELADAVEPDLGTLAVTINGTGLTAKAEPAGHASSAGQVRRTAVMAIDTSRSMRGERFAQAKSAAKEFLEAAPQDVYIGIVAFAGEVTTVQRPTLDRSAAAAVIDSLSLSLQTHLFDGVIAAVDAAGGEGQRSLLVLSDGRDTSKTKLNDVISSIGEADVRVDVVALGEAAQANEPLEQMVAAGDGSVINAENPEALTALFNREASALARQVLVTAPLPPDMELSEGSLTISVGAAGEVYSDTAFVSFGELAGVDLVPKPMYTAKPSPLSSEIYLWLGLGGLAIGLLVVLFGALGVVGHRPGDQLQEQISMYTREGAARHAKEVRTGASATNPTSVTGSAVDLAAKALHNSAGFEARLAGKLEAANLSLKPAEWLLLHSGIAFGAAGVGLLLGSGGILLTTLFLLAGAAAPWLYLGRRKSRRLKAFNSQLAETLQLISGSLSAGLSLAQSLDTVVREGAEPVAGEFRRALVEARLGVQIEDALDTIAKRMDSADFEWVVMAIRIQREVGGNLAELLLSVAGTMRERDYLRRQVKALSAEGRMSAWILGALPIGMLAYMMLTNPTYLKPLLTDPLGWALLGAGTLMMAIGSFWMSRLVKVEV